MNFKETDNIKIYRSDDFNYNFNKNTGFYSEWGVNRKHDSDIGPFPTILDFEITEICKGPGNQGPCKFCYKSNTPNKGSVTTFETAKKIIDKMPKQLTQIAFGVDAQCESNPEWFEIFSYARESGFIPNVTVADVTEETATKLASICGAVAVSRYENKNYCYDSIEKLTNKIGQNKNTINAVNMHIMLSKETIPWIVETINDIKHDKRLSKLNAIVFLSLKRKGRGEEFSPVNQEDFSVISNICSVLHISYGFDSCSAHKYLKSIEGNKNYEKLASYVMPCESTISSSYVNVHGEYFPCSFTEGTEGWEKGINVIECDNFIDDVWNNPKTCMFRERLLMSNCNCPIYNI